MWSEVVGDGGWWWVVGDDGGRWWVVVHIYLSCGTLAIESVPLSKRPASILSIYSVLQNRGKGQRGGDPP